MCVATHSLHCGCEAVRVVLDSVAPACTRNVNCERPHVVNIINLGVTCSKCSSRHYTVVGHSPSLYYIILLTGIPILDRV